MKKTRYFFLAIGISLGQLLTGQDIHHLSKELPPYFSILTEWGVRPDWDETSENIYFLNRLIGDVFKINLKTKEIMCVTAHFYHGGIFRAQCLPNGDLLLAISNNTFDPNDPEKNRHTGLELHVLKKGWTTNPISLGQYCDEGPAVSKQNMKIAWTLAGQREIKTGDIIYEDGIPGLINVHTVVSYADSGKYVRLESQDFRPPDDQELIFTHYWGDAMDQYHHSQVYGINLTNNEVTRYTDLPDSYNEAEGIFPDGKYMLLESDRHQPLPERNKYKLDIYILKLDGSGEAERLADFSTRYPGILRSDNPVVNNTGNFVAHQYGYMNGAGDGKGIFLLDLESFKKQQ
ncbi:MAG: hypothetical protein R6W31_10440 [Bacteroidales bacterium]